MGILPGAAGAEIKN